MTKSRIRGLLLCCLALFGVSYLGLRELWLLKAFIYVSGLFVLLMLPANLKLTIFSLLLFLSLLEAGLHAQNVYLSYKYPEEVRGTGLFEYDPILGWKYKANKESYYSSRKDRFRNKVETNSKGLRDKEYSYEKSKGVSRILLLGDSVTAGLEVEKEYVIDTQLEELLSKGGPYELINAGVQGYGTDQSYLFLKNEGYKYAPDIIIYIAVNNDRTENISVHQRQRPFGKSYFVIEGDDQLVLKGVPPPHFKAEDLWVTSLPLADEFYNKRGEEKPSQEERLSLLRGVKQDLSRLFLYRWLRDRVARNEVLLDIFIKTKLKAEEKQSVSKPNAIKDYEDQITKRLLQELAKYSKSIGAKFLIYEFTNGVGRPPERPTDFEKMSQELGVEYLNSFEEFFSLSEGKRVFCFNHDGHWNPLGHKSAAMSIYENLKARGWIGK